jgi:predicted neutral ceramidase superfamily lipid hydrolase
MRIILGILDFVVVVAVVMTVSRAVWSGQSQSSRSVLLSALIVLVMLVFGVVSFTAAYGLAENSSFNQGALLIFLLAIVIVARMSWADKSAIQP